MIDFSANPILITRHFSLCFRFTVDVFVVDFNYASERFQSKIQTVKGLNPLVLRASIRYMRYSSHRRLDDAVCGIRVTSFVNGAAIIAKSTGQTLSDNRANGMRAGARIA
jgi:hypothetical protein